MVLNKTFKGVVILVGFTTLYSCKNNSNSTENNNPTVTTNTTNKDSDKGISDVDKLLKSSTWVHWENHTVDVCEFDGKMYTYVIKDIDNGGEIVNSTSGEYTIENSNGTYYIKLDMGKMYKLDKTSNGKNLLNGGPPLIQNDQPKS